MTQEEVEEELEKLRDQNSSLVSVEKGPAEEGDFVVIDLLGTYLDVEEGGDTRESFQEENVMVQVGDEHTHEAFTKALAGIKRGEEKEFEVEYGSDYPEKKLAGHKLAFTVQVSDIKKKELPDLNDAFAKDLGEYETLEELQEKIKERLTVERENKSREGFGKQALGKVGQKLEF